MTSIMEALPAAFGPDLNLAGPVLFARYAGDVLPLATALAAIFFMRSTPIVSETRQKNQLLRNRIEEFWDIRYL